MTKKELIELEEFLRKNKADAEASKIRFNRARAELYDIIHNMIEAL